MEQRTNETTRRTGRGPLARAAVIVTGLATAATVPGAPVQSALGADVADRPVMSATGADATSADRDRGYRARNGRLAYDAYIHGVNEVFTIGPRGRGKQRLTHNHVCDGAPDWSPSGRRIAFAACRPEVEIRIMRADGTHQRRLTHDNAIAVFPAWSPSGRWIVYTCRGPSEYDFEICTIRRDGTDRRQLTHNDVDDNFPDWSSKGRIGYTSWDGSDDEIYTINPNGDDRRQVTHNTTDDFGPSFSPSGARIAYNGGFADNDGDIYIKPIAGGPRRAVTHSPARVEDFPSWSPNGRRICYAQDHGDNTEIYTSRINGQDHYRVTHTELTEQACDWGARPRR
jgi:Tol biopolymer transport system component